jgi:hypothetical protein
MTDLVKCYEPHDRPDDDPPNDVKLAIEMNQDLDLAIQAARETLAALLAKQVAEKKDVVEASSKEGVRR